MHAISRIRWIAAALFICFTAAAGGQSTQPAGSAAVALPDKESLHIYLLMGQSNMVGRDTHDMDSQSLNPHIIMMNADGKWVIAKDPVHPQVGRIAPGVGPGMTFAAEMLKSDPDATIGLVPCAVGGTALKRWMKGADLYENAVKTRDVRRRSRCHQGRALAPGGIRLR